MHARTTPAPLTQEIVDTPIGGLALIVDEAGALHMVEFADCLGRIERWLTRALGGPRSSLREGRVTDMVRADFAAYFGGELEALDRLPVALTGTAFQKEVWAALRRIEPGRTFGYGAFAQKLGRPQSARAVGHANGANPLAIVVPCHRLVGADGDLTNYGGGIERKRWLLDHEARHAAGRIGTTVDAPLSRSRTGSG